MLMLLFIIVPVLAWRALILSAPGGSASDELGVVTLLQIHLQCTLIAAFNFKSIHSNALDTFC